MDKKKFSYVMMIGIILLYFAALLSIVLSDGVNMKFLIWNGNTVGIFPDLMQTVYEAKGFHPYVTTSLGAVYPPLTYLICALLAYSIPGELNWISSVTPNGITVLAMFFFTIICSMSLLIYDSLKADKGIRILVIITFLCSAPFIFMIERGNLVVLSVVLCCYYLLYFDSDSTKKREIALICLAIAASLKLYPALLGILLLTDKRYKESLRCIIYGIVIFVLPIFFEGGFGELKGMFESIKYFQVETVLDRRDFGYGFKVNITNWVYALCEQFNISQETTSALNVFFLTFVVIMLLCAIIFGKTKWQKATAALFLLTIIPTFSWIYNVSYMIGGCILFINYLCDEKKISIKNMIYMILFVAMFVPLPYGEILSGLHGANRMSLSTVVSSCAMLIMVVLLFADSFEQLQQFGKKLEQMQINERESSK